MRQGLQVPGSGQIDNEKFSSGAWCRGWAESDRDWFGGENGSDNAGDDEDSMEEEHCCSGNLVVFCQKKSACSTLMLCQVLIRCC